MRKALQIAFYEAKMSSRGWRFWLLLFLILGISLFARRDYLIHTKLGYYLHAGYSFQHPSFWLMLAILGIGTVALALDTCGRLQKTRMDKIFFPLPVGAMEIMWGRLLGVLLVMIPIATIALSSLALWQWMHGHGYIVWQPFLVALFMLVFPLILPIAALTITTRTYLKHDFAALLASLLLGGGIWYWGQEYKLLLDIAGLLRQLENASPTLGANFSLESYWVQLTVHGLISLMLLYLAPFYLRRQQLQQWIVKRSKRIRLFGFSSLLRWVTNLRFDPHLGWKFRLSFTITLILVTAGILWAAMATKESRLKELPASFPEVAVADKLQAGLVDTLRYNIAIEPNHNYTALRITSAVTMQAKHDVRLMGFELNPNFIADELIYQNEARQFDQTKEGIVTFFPKPIPAGEIFQVTFSYHGRPQDLHPNYSHLSSVWYPLPWQKIRARKNGHWIRAEGDLFDAQITVHLLDGQMGAFGGAKQENTESNIETWNTFYPVNALEMTWGKYDYVEENRNGYNIRFYHFPNHAYQSLVFLEEIEEQENYVHERLGRLPFPQLTIIETPYRYNREQQNGNRWFRRKRFHVLNRETALSMPGVVHISENDLRYLHEGMWKLERLDHDPRAIQFYRQLPHILYRVHQEFYRKLISVYFDHSLHPTGDFAFWLRDHLSGYASKLLEKNAWVRKRILNYDVGTGPHLPLSVARRDSLLKLHQDGLYKQLERVRGEGLFRMIHHLLGDEQWWALLKDIFREHRFQDFPIESFLAMAENYYGQSLNWFENKWLKGNALPEFEITLAEARAFENPETMGVDYDIRIQVKNHGTGKINVPIFIETERDEIFRNLWLEPEGENILTLRVPDRPVMAMIDPEYWIVQEPFLNKQKRKREHSYKKILILDDER